MSNYRRANSQGGMFFFTVVLADRSSNLLLDEIDRLRKVYRTVQERRPFETIAICILPDHIHAVWALPKDDPDFSTRWNLIKGALHAASRPSHAHKARRPSARRASSQDRSESDGGHASLCPPCEIADGIDLTQPSPRRTDRPAIYNTPAACHAASCGRGAVGRRCPRDRGSR